MLSSFIASKKSTDMLATILYEKQPQNASKHSHALSHMQFPCSEVLCLWDSVSYELAITISPGLPSSEGLTKPRGPAPKMVRTQGCWQEVSVSHLYTLSVSV